MNTRDRHRNRDPDDWFDEPEPSPRQRVTHTGDVDPDARTREQAALDVEDWLGPAQRPRGRRSGGTALSNRHLLVAGGIALALLLIGLAAGGVFSGSSHKHTNPPVTTQRASTTTQAPPPSPVPSVTLKLGDHSTAVKQLQQALSSLGYAPGKADGVFGASTQRALMAFQSAQHLTADGVLGQATRAALVKALSSSG